MSELNSPSMADLSRTLVSSGLVSASDMASARAAHAASGGSLAVHLVLLGAVDEGALAAFLAEAGGMPRPSLKELDAAHPNALIGIPFEVVYAGGFIPFAAMGSGTVLVGVMDPVEPSGFGAAELMSGKNFVLRLCSVTQFSALFEKVTGRAWKVLPQDVEVARREIGAANEQLDEELKSLFFPGAEGTQVAVELVDDTGDEPLIMLPKAGAAATLLTLEEDDLEEVSAPFQAIGGPVLGGGSAAAAKREGGFTLSASYAILGPNQTVDLAEEDVIEERDSSGSRAPAIAIELVDESSLEGEAVLELKPSGGGRSTDSLEALRALDDVEAGAVSRHADLATATNVTTTIHGIDPRILPLREVKSAEELTGASGARGSEVTPAMAVERVPDDMWSELEAATPGLSSSQRTPTTGVPAVLAAESGTRQLLVRSGESSVVGSGGTIDSAPRHRSLSFSMAGEAFSGTPRPVPTVGEFLDESEGCFFSRDSYLARAAEPDEATKAVFELTRNALEAATDRDTIARQLVETLSLAYPTVLLLSLRPPDVVVWDGVLSTGADGPLGLEFPLSEDGLWHRVATTEEVFVGTLPGADALRRALPRAFGAQACVVPLLVRRRVVALLVLDSGSSSELASPGSDIFALAGWVESALKRVIVQRKNASRSF